MYKIPRESNLNEIHWHIYIYIKYDIQQYQYQYSDFLGYIHARNILAG
jgi:hypothetical protein